MADNFAKNILADLDNKYAGVVGEDGIAAGDVEGFIDTGCYMLNAILSGTIFGGIPNTKVTGFAGSQATGKTFFLLNIFEQFQRLHEDGFIFLFESESAISTKMLEDHGIDLNRVAVIPVVTIEEFKTQACKALDSYIALAESKRKPIFMALDSLGMLSTEKEIADTAEGKNVRDMTRAQLVKGAFRVLTLKLGRAKVPMVITNHTYDTMGMFSAKEISGGSGFKYAASTIIMLAKKKVKDGADVVGNFIICKAFKNRIARENTEATVYLDYGKGLDRYSGLVELGLKYGIFKKVSRKIEWVDGEKYFEKHIRKNSEKLFTQELLEELDKCAQREFSYGKQEEDEGSEEPDETEDE